MNPNQLDMSPARGPRPADTWPPEVPPFRPPGPPTEPPGPQPMPPPRPILPSWEEPDPGTFERDVANRLLEQRVITVSGRLDDALADVVTRQLLLLGRDNRRAPITMHLSCRESELGAALALADAVDLAGAPVRAVVHGTLHGPAVAVLCAAAERAAHRNAMVVLSLPEESGGGTASRLASLAEQHELQVGQLCRRIAQVTGRGEDEVAADLEAGRLLSAEEAKDYGLVDEVV